MRLCPPLTTESEMTDFFAQFPKFYETSETTPMPKRLAYRYHLIVEQNPSMALKYCSRFYVLRNGVVALEGRSDEYRNDQEAMRTAYLGV